MGRRPAPDPRRVAARADRIAAQAAEHPTWEDAAASDVLAWVTVLLRADTDPRADLASVLPVADRVLAGICTRWGCDRPARGVCRWHRQQDAGHAERVLRGVAS